ncbi:MAG: GDSL-type esterase/lipase family protein [Geminicoccaceae bacterium]
MSSLLQKLLLLSMATIVSLVALEGALRAFVPVRNVGPSFTAYDPVYGKRLKADASTIRTTPEFEMQLTTNSLGFRGAEPVPSARPPVLFLGDSFTMGYGVSDGAEFPALIARYFQDLEEDDPVPVINAGLGNNGNGRSLKFLRREAATIDPALVVLQLTGNDAFENANEKLFKLGTAGAELVELSVSKPGILNKVQSGIESVPGLADTYVIGWSRQVVETATRFKRSQQKAFFPDDQSDRLTLRLVEEHLSLLQGMGWPAVVLAVEIEEQRLAAIQALTDRYDVDLLTMPSKNERPDFYYRVDNHWNAGGHDFAAARLIQWLEQNRDVWDPSAISEEGPALSLNQGLDQEIQP